MVSVGKFDHWFGDRSLPQHPGPDHDVSHDGVGTDVRIQVGVGGRFAGLHEVSRLSGLADIVEVGAHAG